MFIDLVSMVTRDPLDFDDIVLILQKGPGEFGKGDGNVLGGVGGST
jgi:hypothetical protein